MSITSPSPLPTRAERRAAVGARLLDGLEALIARHRALALSAADDGGLHAELIAAEVAHELAVARARLNRMPPLAPPTIPPTLGAPQARVADGNGRTARSA